MGGQPTKYVFTDERRIAQVTGALDPQAPRVQRLMLWPGWNAVSILVDAADTAQQLGVDGAASQEEVWVWSTPDQAFVLVEANSLLPPGSMLWIHADSAQTRVLRGLYQAPAAELTLDAGYAALPSFASLDPLPLLEEDPESLWRFANEAQAWRPRVTGDTEFLDSFPRFNGPGQPFFVRDGDGQRVALPPESTRIRYYHGDHLGSANIVTDGSGTLVEESVFYPYGALRAEYRSAAHEAQLPNPYRFGQKELDKESGLYYFDQRYLAAALCRFTRVDPLASDPEKMGLEDPQKFHAYAFARNNPLMYSDPSGEAPATLTARLKKIAQIRARRLTNLPGGLSGSKLVGLTDRAGTAVKALEKQTERNATLRGLIQGKLGSADVSAKTLMKNAVSGALKEKGVQSGDKLSSAEMVAKFSEKGNFKDFKKALGTADPTKIAGVKNLDKSVADFLKKAETANFEPFKKAMERLTGADKPGEEKDDDSAEQQDKKEKDTKGKPDEAKKLPTGAKKIVSDAVLSDLKKMTPKDDGLVKPSELRDQLGTDRKMPHKKNES